MEKKLFYSWCVFFAVFFFFQLLSLLLLGCKQFVVYYFDRFVRITYTPKVWAQQKLKAGLPVILQLTSARTANNDNIAWIFIIWCLMLPRIFTKCSLFNAKTEFFKFLIWWIGIVWCCLIFHVYSVSLLYILLLYMCLPQTVHGCAKKFRVECVFSRFFPSFYYERTKFYRY